MSLPLSPEITLAIEIESARMFELNALHPEEVAEALGEDLHRQVTAATALRVNSEIRAAVDRYLSTVRSVPVDLGSVE